MAVIEPTTHNAADSAFAHIKSRILTGDLDGQLISEGEFAAELGVSRTPVREAFLRLQAEGLMRLYPKRGALVVPIGPDEAQEVLQARLLIETAAVSGALADPELPGRLHGILAEQRAAVGTPAFAERDADFHYEFVAAGGNSLITTFYRMLRDRQQRLAMRILGTPELPERILDAHARIIGVLESGDAEALRAEITAHIDRAYGREGN